jgi:hypothetical protein
MTVAIFTSFLLHCAANKAICETVWDQFLRSQVITLVAAFAIYIHSAQEHGVFVVAMYKCHVSRGPAVIGGEEL